MAEHIIMGVLVNHRSKKAPHVQTILTKYGCTIKMRLGLHEVGDLCSEEGLIILKVAGEEADITALENELKSVEGVKVNKMVI